MLANVAKTSTSATKKRKKTLQKYCMERLNKQTAHDS